MPRKAKEDIVKVEKETVKKEVKNKKVASTKAASTKSVSETKNKKVVDKKTPSKKSNKTTSEKGTVNKRSKKVKQNKASSVKTVNKKSISKTSKSTANSSSIKKSSTSKKQINEKVEIVEYYDLPYRYNQTVVKILAQTPNTLFVYWDISDDDKNKYIEQYGEYFFHNTKPVLIIHNKTKNYSYEVDINDFANSWYLNLVDSNCDYEIELGRRPINEYVNIFNNYLYITTSNKIELPNDRILIDKLSDFVYFKNIKTNETIKKNINLSLLNKIGKFSSISEFYKKLYPEEAIDFNRLDLRNPSSGNPTSNLK